MDLETLTLELFQSHLGSAFSVALSNGETLPLTLAEVNPLSMMAQPNGRTPFMLLLRHPSLPQNAHLPQRIYPLVHPTLGTLDLFIVPLGPDAQGMRYEVIFT